MSDDERELELLRMAALQTIKQSAEQSAVKTCKQAHNTFNQYQHRRKYPFVSTKRGTTRNGQLNGRKITHTNLISIPTMESPAGKEQAEKANKLDLPQNRYCNSLHVTDDDKKESSKFSRYDDSNSESDNSDSDVESEGKLSRANSLDALMDELEAEITGEKVTKAKKRRSKQEQPEIDTNPSIDKESVDKAEKTEAVELHCDSIVDDLAADAIEDVKEEDKVPEVKEKVATPSPERSRTPEPPMRSQHKVVECKPLVKAPQRPPLLPKPRDRDFITRNGEDRLGPVGGMYPESYRHGAYPQYPPLPLPPPSSYPEPFPSNLPPARPLSPLCISQEAITTRVMAPLSPRSAAFVLQNRKIIEKRKRSPRHSYSRSPSPRPRRSKSPRRQQSRSPRRYARSSSPRRTSPGRRLRSPVKSRARSPAERTRLAVNPKRTERASSNETAAKHKPEQSEKAEVKSEGRSAREGPTEKDAILAARRKKFEQQSAAKEGIIRLKPEQKDIESRTPETVRSPVQELEEPDAIDSLREDETEAEEVEAIDADTLDTGIDDLFSDEESEDENEGRFKSTNRQRGDVPVLAFSSLDKTTNIANKPLESNYGRERSNRDRCRRRGDRGARDSARKHHSSSPTKERVDSRDDHRRLRRDEDSLRRTRDTERSDEKKTVVRSAAGRRVEMLDKTAKSDRVKASDAKTEKNHSGKQPVDSSERPEKLRSGGGGRKVAIAVDHKENKEEKPKEEVTVIDDDDEHDVLKKNAAGDLRAQLSRKRAERQSQKPAVKTEDVQSRLLHNALGAVFQKAKRSKRNDVGAAPKEKLPIHKRLGLNDESTNQKKKIKRSTEQV